MVFAIGDWCEELAERQIRRIAHEFRLDIDADFLLRRQIGRVEPGGAQRGEPGVGDTKPARPIAFSERPRTES
jgi:hypothetical protein